MAWSSIRCRGEGRKEETKVTPSSHNRQGDRMSWVTLVVVVLGFSREREPVGVLCVVRRVCVCVCVCVYTCSDGDWPVLTSVGHLDSLPSRWFNLYSEVKDLRTRTEQLLKANRFKTQEMLIFQLCFDPRIRGKVLVQRSSGRKKSLLPGRGSAFLLYSGL